MREAPSHILKKLPLRSYMSKNNDTSRMEGEEQPQTSLGTALLALWKSSFPVLYSWGSTKNGQPREEIVSRFNPHNKNPERQAFSFGLGNVHLVVLLGNPFQRSIPKHGSDSVIDGTDQFRICIFGKWVCVFLQDDGMPRYLQLVGLFLQPGLKGHVRYRGGRGWYGGERLRSGLQCRGRPVGAVARRATTIDMQRARRAKARACKK